MPTQTNWYVVTGTLHSGKTPLINYLSFLGYRTFPEIARLVIDLDMSRGKTIDEIRQDEFLFQQRINKLKIDKESSMDPIQPIFLDRGIPDDIAYCRLRGDSSPYLTEVARQRIYKQVFILDPLPFKKDYARTEDEQTARRIDWLIRDAYGTLGYLYIPVPIMPLDERAKFILDSAGI